MAEDNIRVRIDDDDDGAGSAPWRGSDDANVKAAEAERNRAFAERAYLQNQLLRTRCDQVAAEIQHTTVAAEAAEVALKNDLEAGDMVAAARRNREISQIEVRRLNLEQTAAQLQATPPLPADPLEAYCAGRTEPTRRWLQEHRDWVTDPKKNVRLTAAHWSAVADELVPDSPAYFEAVEKAIGLRDGGRARGDNGDDVHRTSDVTVRKHRRGDPIPSGAVRMTKGEYEAATQIIKWDRDDPQGRFKKHEPIGVREYLRRKELMQQQGGWYDRPESY
jgi:hypothetical protein